jgi:hypothetical protein
MFWPQLDGMVSQALGVCGYDVQADQQMFDNL